MARGVNKVILIGNLGRDPELRYTPSGMAVVNAALATSESWKDKQTGDTKEHTEWHRVVFYQRLAEIVAEYLHKGSKIYVEGRLKTTKWQDKNSGQDRYTTEIIAESMQMLDSKGSGTMDTATSYEKPTSASATLIPAIESAPSLDHFDDDVPF